MREEGDLSQHKKKKLKEPHAKYYKYNVNYKIIKCKLKIGKITYNLKMLMPYEYNKLFLNNINNRNIKYKSIYSTKIKMSNKLIKFFHLSSN